MYSIDQARKKFYSNTWKCTRSQEIPKEIPDNQLYTLLLGNKYPGVELHGINRENNHDGNDVLRCVVELKQSFYLFTTY